MFGIQDFTRPIVDFSNFEFSQLGDALIFGAAIALIGMITIFAVLCLLWLCLVVFKIVFERLGNKRSAKKSVEVVNSVLEDDNGSKSADDGEIIAVIAAAIAMAESENSGMKFKVVSFRRV